MGLNISHEAYNGSYSMFHEWRKWIGSKINIDLDEMRGFGGKKKFDTSHPLYPLLNHSDCDGEISWKKCKVIADALREILDKNPEDSSEIGFYILTTETFINGCILAWQSKENLEFS